MSGNRQERRAYPHYRPGYTWGRHVVDAGLEAAANRMLDVGLGGVGGILSRTPVQVAATSPASWNVEIPAIEGYDRLGEHCRKATTTTLDCSETYGGVPTAPTGGNRWISIFCAFAWSESDPHVVPGYPSVFNYLRTESVEFLVYAGLITTETDRTKVPPVMNPGGGVFRVCDIWLTEGMSGIASGNIEYEGVHQDRIGTAVLTSGGSCFRPIYGPRGGNLVECHVGRTQFASMWDPISSEPTLVKYVPPVLQSSACVGAYINHGFPSPHVMIHKKVNMNASGTWDWNYIDLSDLAQTDLAAYPGFGPGLLWTFHVHDGAENYTGQTGVLAIGQSSWVSSMLGRYLRWMAFMPMLEV